MKNTCSSSRVLLWIFPFSYKRDGCNKLSFLADVLSICSTPLYPQKFDSGRTALEVMVQIFCIQCRQQNQVANYLTKFKRSVNLSQVLVMFIATFPKYIVNTILTLNFLSNFYFGGTGFCSQSFLLGKQMLFQLSHASSPFCFYYVGSCFCVHGPSVQLGQQMTAILSFLPRLAQTCDPPNLSLMSSWDYRCGHCAQPLTPLLSMAFFCISSFTRNFYESWSID